MTSKNVKVYVYQLKIDLPSEYKLTEIFNKDNLEDLSVNVERLGENLMPHLLLIDKSKDNFLFGRFMKLRKFTPRRLNFETKKEQGIRLKKAENLEEISHFVWNTEDQIMLGEYNFHAIRIWSASFTEYLNNLFRRRFSVETNAEVTVKLNTDTVEALKRDPTEIKKVYFRVVQDDFSTISELYGIKKMLRRGRKGYRHCLSMSISSYWNNDVIGKGEVITFAEQHKKDNNTRGLKVTTGDGVYDLFKENCWYYPIQCVMDGNNIKQSKKFYTLVEEEYTNNIDDIKKAIESD